MNLTISQALAFALPALSLVFRNLPASTNPWVNLLQKAALAALAQASQQAAPAAFQAHVSTPHRFNLPASVTMPPEHEWTEAGLENWAKANIKP